MASGNMKEHQKAPQDNWRYRRRVVFGALFWIAFMVMWIIFRGTDSSLYSDVAVALIGAGVAIIGTYVFGAAWDDHSKRRFPARRDGEQ